MSSHSSFKFGFLALDLGLRCAAAHTLGLGALQVLGRNPARVISLGTGCNSRAVCTENGNLVLGINGLASTGGALGALAALTTALLLGKESRDPGVVDEVHSSGKGTEKDEVEEDAIRGVSVCLEFS